jgi:hypothetical protein
MSSLPLSCLQVALKTLIVIHRLLREGDPTLREEILNFSQRGRILQLSNFKDDSSPIGYFFDLIISISHFRGFQQLFFEWYSREEIWIDLYNLFARMILIACSLGLFCMGTYLCIIFGRKTWMLSDSEVWYWSRASTQTYPRAGEGNLITCYHTLLW